MKERCAVYLRVSTGDQTVENQRLDLEKLADLRGWKIVKVYSDPGVSGSKGRERRPGLDELLKDAAKRKFDRFLCWSVDRLGRSTAVVTDAMEHLKKAGVAQFYFKESMDTTTPHGAAMLEMSAVFAKLEKEMIGARVKSGLARAKAQGKTVGRPKTGADVEQRVREMLADKKMGQIAIAKELKIGVGTVHRVKVQMERETGNVGTALN